MYERSSISEEEWSVNSVVYEWLKHGIQMFSPDILNNERFYLLIYFQYNRQAPRNVGWHQRRQNAGI